MAAPACVHRAHFCECSTAGVVRLGAGKEVVDSSAADAPAAGDQHLSAWQHGRRVVPPLVGHLPRVSEGSASRVVELRPRVVDRVAPAGDEHPAVRQKRCSVIGACMQHRAGGRGLATGRIVELRLRGNLIVFLLAKAAGDQNLPIGEQGGLVLVPLRGHCTGCRELSTVRVVDLCPRREIGTAHATDDENLSRQK